MRDEKKEESGSSAQPQVHHQGYLKNLLMMNSPAVKQKFSSLPLDPETNSDSTTRGAELTEAERAYLESLLQKGDATLIERASQRLCDPLLFPPLDQCSRKATASTQETTVTVPGDAAAERVVPKRRNSHLQQELFRLHETNGLQPSQVLQRMNLLQHRNSILDSGDELDALSGGGSTAEKRTTEASISPHSSLGPHHQQDDDESSSLLSDTAGGDSSAFMESWNPFKDVASWLDGSQGVEVGDNGVPLPKQSGRISHQAPFGILGTTADDVSCHPHVLSPPLMESLLAFVPESLSLHNFWLKYSLVRDGANLWTLLRQVRASDNTFLAIETIDGHVFGSFTCQAWRLAQGWYGSKESFLWKMRRSRLETTRSIVQQAYQESEVQVYPYRTGNVAVQYCSKEGLMLGQGELLPSTQGGRHYGHGLYLDASLMYGTTSTSETFGNPCLVDGEQRGASFEVSNIEVWTLTPHRKVGDAEQSEMSSLFLEGARDGTDSLNIMNILVGGPI